MAQPNKKEKKEKHKVGYRGDVPGCHIGQIWEKRVDMWTNGMHAQTMAGIDGSGEAGCYSIVISAGYEDDEDNGEEVIYTGCGGQNPATKEQEKDQEFKGKNAALVTSCVKNYPVRVIRGFSCPSPLAPVTGYRYDGLYQVMSYWKEQGRSGFQMCRYRLKRLPDQPVLPAPRTDCKRKGHKKRSSAHPKMDAVLRNDAKYLCASVESAAQRAAQGFCVVCEKMVEGGCGFEHFEMHIQELWNAFQSVEQEKIAQRAVINEQRISSVVDALTLEVPVVPPPPSSPSSVFQWP